MTNEQLLDLIDADHEASRYAASGNDDACAKRISAILPPVVFKRQMGRMGILALYANPGDGATVLGTIKAVATVNPIVAEIYEAIHPTVPESNMPDWSLPGIRAALTVEVGAGGLGLTQVLADPILRACERPGVVTTDEVSKALLVRRPEGKI